MKPSEAIRKRAEELFRERYMIAMPCMAPGEEAILEWIDEHGGVVPAKPDAYFARQTDAELREAGATFPVAQSDACTQCGHSRAGHEQSPGSTRCWVGAGSDKRCPCAAFAAVVTRDEDCAVVEPAGETIPKRDRMRELAECARNCAPGSEHYRDALCDLRMACTGRTVSELLDERDTALAAAERWRKSSEQYQALALERFDQLRDARAEVARLERELADTAQRFAAFRSEARGRSEAATVALGELETKNAESARDALKLENALRGQLATVERERDEHAHNRRQFAVELRIASVALGASRVKLAQMTKERDDARMAEQDIIEAYDEQKRKLTEQLSASNAEVERLRGDLELWCYDQALTAVTKSLVARTGNRGDVYEMAMACVAETRQALGVAGYGNSGQSRPKLDQPAPPREIRVGQALEDCRTADVRAALAELARRAGAA